MLNFSSTLQQQYLSDVKDAPDTKLPTLMYTYEYHTGTAALRYWWQYIVAGTFESIVSIHFDVLYVVPGVRDAVRCCGSPSERLFTPLASRRTQASVPKLSSPPVFAFSLPLFPSVSSSPPTHILLQGFHSRITSHFYTTPASARQQPSHQCLEARQPICRASRPAAALSAAGGVDGIDPLEAGPDIDPLEAGPDAVESAQEGGDAASAKAPRTRKASKAGDGQPAEDEADQAALAALASAKDTAAKQTKKKRKRADPFMPKGSVAPIEWQDFTPLDKGCRAHLVRAVMLLCGRGWVNSAVRGRGALAPSGEHE